MESEEEQINAEQSEETALINAVAEREKAEKIKPAKILTEEQKFELSIKEIPEYQELIKYLNEKHLLVYLKMIANIEKITFVLKSFKSLGDIFGYKYHNNSKIGVYLFNYDNNLSLGVHLPRMINSDNYREEKFVICEYILTLGYSGIKIYKAENISLPDSYSCHMHAEAGRVTTNFCLGNNFLSSINKLFQDSSILLSKSDVEQYPKFVEEVISYFCITVSGDDGSIYSNNRMGSFIVTNINYAKKDSKKYLLNTEIQDDLNSHAVSSINIIIRNLVDLAFSNSNRLDFKEIIHIKDNLFTINPAYLEKYFIKTINHSNHYVDKDGFHYLKTSEDVERVSQLKSYYFETKNNDGVCYLTIQSNESTLIQSLIFKNEPFNEVLSFYYTNYQNDGLYFEGQENLYFLQNVDEFLLSNHSKRMVNFIYNKEGKSNKKEIITDLIPFRLLNNEYFINSLHDAIKNKIINNMNSIETIFLGYIKENHL
jgi:hypothetical protein